MPTKKEFPWIPWQRYVFILNIDGKDCYLGRYRRYEGLAHRLNDLSQYAGYKARIIDTKEVNNANKKTNP